MREERGEGEKEREEARITTLPPPPSSLTPGGSAANVARAVAALAPARPVTFIGAAGSDAVAVAYARGLAAARVDAALLPGPPRAPTGTCLALVTPDGQRTMRTCLGAAAGLTDEGGLPAGWAAGAAAVHLEGYTLWRPHLATGLLRAGRAAGVGLTSIDCASVECVAAKGGEVAAALGGGLIDVVFCNEDEAAALAPHLAADRRPSNDDGDDDDDRVGAVLTACVAAGARVAVATLGAAGARAAFREGGGGDAIAHARSPASPVPVVADTVGAGDAFAGGVLAALLAGAPPPAALAVGCAAGAAAVAAHGADPGEAAWAGVRAALAEAVGDKTLV